MNWAVSTGRRQIYPGGCLRGVPRRLLPTGDRRPPAILPTGPWRRSAGRLFGAYTPSSWPRPVRGWRLRLRLGRQPDCQQPAGQEGGWRGRCAGHLRCRANWVHGCGPRPIAPESGIAGGCRRLRRIGRTAGGGMCVQLRLHSLWGFPGSTPVGRPVRHQWAKLWATAAGEQRPAPGGQ